ncbi:MAG: PilN domain-containing protein [Armatimonadetes bacterium]|nr:PilN domain-containing protein [Armatimonadota bacterium]
MPKINLIQEQRNLVSNELKKRRVLLTTFMSTFLVGGGIYSGLFLQTESLLGQRADYQSKVDKMKPLVDAIEANEQQFAVLSPRLTTLEDAGITTQRWARVLDHISRSVPEGIWLISMRCNQPSEQDPVTVEVQGFGPTQELVSELILRLQGTKDLENVMLKYTQGDVAAENKSIRFEVAAQIAGSAKLPPITEKKEGDTKENGA